jgi:L-threonylcarbamoyladenylate synthase
VLCSSDKKAKELVNLSGKAAELAAANWPGALTIVAPLLRQVPWLLSQGTSNLGVRVPASPMCVLLIKKCGGWLTGTSANLSGRPSARSAEEAMAQLGSSVEMVLDGGRLGGKESTVVQVVGDELTILRGGPVRVDEEMKGRRT